MILFCVFSSFSLRLNVFWDFEWCKKVLEIGVCRFGFVS